MTAKFLGIGLAATLLTCVTATPMQAKADDTRFSSPIVGSAVGTTIAGIPSGGAPWVVSQGRARLGSDSSLEVEVTGLLLASGPSAGTTGGIAQVFASVVCGDIVQADTDAVTFPPSGSFEIRAMVTLPQPACQGAVVLIRIVRATVAPPPPFIAATGVLD
ncbi:MAG TPA: hypothetical protein VNW90_09150 [Acetobacteraceae bacterium]|jgi:hypothetical protein|nr:hypothetical protein [Acetobacteraceae bacterium]